MYYVLYQFSDWIEHSLSDLGEGGVESTPPVGNRELLLILLSKLLPITFDFKDMVIEQLLAKKNLKFFWGVPPSGPLDQWSP